MTIVLLMMALTASAQETKNGVTSGKMSAISSQKEISYSFSGGTVTRDDMQGSGDGGHYDYEVEEGATINLSCSGTENVLIGVTANNKSTVLASGAKSASCSYKVPTGLKKFRITMSCIMTGILIILEWIYIALSKKPRNKQHLQQRKKLRKRKPLRWKMQKNIFVPIAIKKIVKSGSTTYMER